MFTKKIRAKEELVNGRATGIKIPFSFMPFLRNERERNGFGVLSAPKEIAKKGGQSLFYRKSMDYFSGGIVVMRDFQMIRQKRCDAKIVLPK